MSTSAAPAHRSESQSLVPGVCGWPSVGGRREVLPLLPFWSVGPPRPSSAGKQPRARGPGDWPMASSSAGCWACGRRQEVSQDQSAPYSSELGSVWDRGTVHASCFSSGTGQDMENATSLRAGSSPPTDGLTHPQRETLPLSCRRGRDGDTQQRKKPGCQDAPCP